MVQTKDRSSKSAKATGMPNRCANSTSRAADILQRTAWYQSQEKPGANTRTQWNGKPTTQRTLEPCLEEISLPQAHQKQTRNNEACVYPKKIMTQISENGTLNFEGIWHILVDISCLPKTIGWNVLACRRLPQKHLSDCWSNPPRNTKGMRK